MAGPDIPRCGQWVIIPNGADCCGGASGDCGQPAGWVHRASGLALCDEHESGARRFAAATPGYWKVGHVSVTYPEGWERVHGVPVPELPPSGLVLL